MTRKLYTQREQNIINKYRLYDQDNKNLFVGRSYSDDGSLDIYSDDPKLKLLFGLIADEVDDEELDHGGVMTNYFCPSGPAEDNLLLNIARANMDSIHLIVNEL